MTSAARAGSTVGCVLLIFPAPAVSVISPAARPELMTTLPFVPAAALWMCPMLIGVPAGRPVISLGRRSPSASSGAPGDGAGHAIAPIHRLAPGRACLVSPACADRHCGAGPRLAADGCFPLPCPVESGLSSTAFAAATVWPARTTILGAACVAQERVHPLRRAYERVVGGSAALGDVSFDDHVRVARASPFAQVGRETDRIEETAAQMRRRPAHQDDAALGASRAFAGEIAMHQSDRPGCELDRRLLGVRVAALL